ncbi:MAG TPA: alpha/beta hydrolase [Glaciihabitans sp.]|nr:alpha/beta hydrolase [Glaciihabitans sp.]
MSLLGWLRREKAPILHVAGDAGEGPVVILVHGIASSSVTFRRLVPLLTDKHRAISIDLLGFGESVAPADATFTLDEHVAALAATIDSLDLRAPFTLVGHSLGSLISARYAATRPQRVARLVLVSPPIYLAPAELGDPRVRSQVSAYLKAYEFIRENKDFTIGNAARIGRILQISEVFEISERNWNAFILSLKNCIEAQTTISDIAAVRVPIDVVYGALDQFIAPGTMRIIEQMRHVTMHKVEVNDHLVRKRLAKAVARVIG